MNPYKFLLGYFFAKQRINFEVSAGLILSYVITFQILCLDNLICYFLSTPGSYLEGNFIISFFLITSLILYIYYNDKRMSHLSHEFLERYGKTPFLNGVKVIAIIYLPMIFFIFLEIINQ
jgi:hypothetical protein